MTGAGMDRFLADFQNKKAPYFLFYCKKKISRLQEIFFKTNF